MVKSKDWDITYRSGAADRQIFKCTSGFKQMISAPFETGMTKQCNLCSQMGIKISLVSHHF